MVEDELLLLCETLELDEVVELLVVLDEDVVDELVVLEDVVEELLVVLDEVVVDELDVVVLDEVVELLVVLDDEVVLELVVLLEVDVVDDEVEDVDELEASPGNSNQTDDILGALLAPLAVQLISIRRSL